MDILLAIIMPPLAVRRSSRSSRTLRLNCLFWAAGVLPGIVHALLIVSQSRAQQRRRRMPLLGRPNPFGTAQ